MPASSVFTAAEPSFTRDSRADLKRLTDLGYAAPAVVVDDDRGVSRVPRGRPR